MVPASDGAFAKPGAWKVTVVDDINRAAAKENALTITATDTKPADPDTSTGPVVAANQTFTAKPDEDKAFKVSGSGFAGLTGAQAETTGKPVVQATAFHVTPDGTEVAFNMTLGEGNLEPRPSPP